MGVFGDWAIRYWENGYNVIPVVHSTGGSALTEWQRWSTERQSEEYVEELVEKFGDLEAIGLVTGPATNFSAIDIDCDLPMLDEYLPWHTSMIRRAAKGHVFHVQYIEPKNVLIDLKTGELSGTIYKQNLRGVADMLLSHSYAIAPPSMHKDGMHIYRWVKDTNLEPADQLDRLDKFDVDTIYGKCLDLYRQLEAQRDAKDGIASTRGLEDNILGRNDYLSKAAYAMAHRIRDEGGGQIVDEKIRELLELDQKKHPNNPWFLDEREPHKGRNPEAAARKMLMQKLKAIERVEIIEVGHDYVNRLKAKIKARQPSAKINFSSRQWTDLLPEGGVYEKFYALCKQEQGSSASVALSMASCTGLIAGALSNKRRFKQTWPNVYIWALAPSGVGKNAPTKMAKQVMMARAEQALTLIGPSKFASSNAFIGETAKRRERVDFIDEITLMYEQMNKPAHPLFGTRDHLLEMFSASGSVFNGVSAKTKDAQVGVIANPCVSFVGSGVLSRFSNVLTDTDFEQGLLARSLVFIEDGKEIIGNENFTAYGWGTEDTGNLQQTVENIAVRLSKFWNEPFNQKVYDIGNPVDPVDWPHEPELADLHNQYGAHAISKVRELSLSESTRDLFMAAAYSRKMELVMKLEQIYAASQGLEQITKQCFFWAVDVWELQMQSQLKYLFAKLDEIGADPRDTLENDIYDLMLKHLQVTGKPVLVYNDIAKIIANRSRKLLKKDRGLLDKWVSLAQREGKIIKQNAQPGRDGTKGVLIFNLDEI